VDPRNTSRRNFLGLAAGVPLAGAALAACGSGKTAASGSSSPAGSAAAGSGAAGGAATYWFLSGQPQQTVREDAVKRFNSANSGSEIKITEFPNDSYKTKIKTALGAGQGPTIIWGWGGGGLAEYVKNGQVEDLTPWFEQNPDQKKRRFQSSFLAATVNDKIYALPAETVTPIVFYYNKQVFDKIGAEPPKSWADIMSIVEKCKSKNVAAFSLGGQSRWTNMMWLEFLLDRIGGPEIFNNVLAGKADAWSDPAVLDMLTKVQELVKAGGFVKGFSSITADSNADLAVLYTGRAAMMVHGAWTYGTMKANGGKFVSDGHLGYMNFPPVEPGKDKGDPTNTVGNPGQYYSINSKASDAEKETAKKFFATVLDDTEQQKWIGNGSVPLIQGADSKFSGPDAEWLKFVYNIGSGAKTFSQSWDQAMSPSAAETLLDNIAKLFQLQVTPQQWVDNLNKVIGK
jgi:raffinose/stachyose/melibiose transport system substrate-binding protein